MTKPDEKRGPFRQPKVKTLGLRVPSLPSPHEAFIPQSEAPALSSPVPGAPPQGEPAHSALLQDAQAQDAPAKTPLVQASPSQSRKDAPLRGSVRHTAPDAQDSVLPVTPVPSTPVHQPMGAKPREEQFVEFDALLVLRSDRLGLPIYPFAHECFRGEPRFFRRAAGIGFDIDLAAVDANSRDPWATV